MGVIQWIQDVGEFHNIANSVAVITDESIELARKTTYLEIPRTFSQARVRLARTLRQDLNLRLS